MINLKHVLGLSVVLLVFAGTFFTIKHWGHLPLQAKTNGSAEDSTEQIKNTSLSVPDEFIEFGSQAGQSNNKNFTNLPTQTLWQNLLTGFHAGKTVQIGLENALITRLQKESGHTIYNELLAQFNPGILDTSAQQVLVSLLGEIGTASAAEALIRLMNSSLLSNPDVKLTALHALSKFSPESWQEQPNTQLATVFEAAWQQTQDAEFMSAIANVMASIGTQSSLDIFIQTLTENTNNERVDIVKQAMTNLANPALIPKLASLLQNSPENVQIASAYALPNIGNIEAAQVIINFAAQSDVSRIDLIGDLAEKIANTSQEVNDYMNTQLPKTVFKDLKIKQEFLDRIRFVQSGVE